MTNSKHMPRWHLEDGANSHIFDGRVVNEQGTCFAFTMLDTDEGRMIVAAPDLLFALEQLVCMAVVWETVDCRKNIQLENSEAYQRARVVIAKAKGES